MMSEILTTLIVDAETGKTNERELNEEEMAQRKKDAAVEKNLEKEAKAKAEARASALAKLAALGLTEAEIASL
jgi:hypothetical protein